MNLELPGNLVASQEQRSVRLLPTSCGESSLPYAKPEIQTTETLGRAFRLSPFALRRRIFGREVVVLLAGKFGAKAEA